MISRQEENRLRLAEQSDIFDGWEWLSAKQLRTCAAFLFMDGMQFSLYTPFDDVKKCTNNVCRCTPIAVIAGMNRPKRLLGAEWFATLSDDEKKLILSHG
jgi:hypothetical protein